MTDRQRWRQAQAVATGNAEQQALFAGGTLYGNCRRPDQGQTKQQTMAA